jgi:hypothetical protein
MKRCADTRVFTPALVAWEKYKVMIPPDPDAKP